MKILRNSNQLFKLLKKLGANIGFVPTMGGIHWGHLSLIKMCNYKSNKTLISIYVYPTQFNKKSDFSKYPRNIYKKAKT